MFSYPSKASISYPSGAVVHSGDVSHVSDPSISYRWISYPSIVLTSYPSVSYRSEWPGPRVNELRIDQPPAREARSNPLEKHLLRYDRPASISYPSVHDHFVSTRR